MPPHIHVSRETRARIDPAEMDAQLNRLQARARINPAEMDAQLNRLRNQFPAARRGVFKLPSKTTAFFVFHFIIEVSFIYL